MATVIVILLILVAAYCIFAPSREEEVLAEQGGCPEQRELNLINTKIDWLETIDPHFDGSHGSLLRRIIALLVTRFLALGTWILLLGGIIALFASTMPDEIRLELIGAAIGACVLGYLLVDSQRKLVLLKNRKKFLENFLSAKRSGNYDEATLNEIKKALETKMKYDNEADLEQFEYIA